MAKKDVVENAVENDTFDGIGGVDNAAAAKEVDVFAELPSFVVDKNWKQGRTLAGKFISTKMIFSDKFTAGRIDPKTGKMCRARHILEDAKGNKFVIWGVGTLNVVMARLRPNQYVELTYIGRAEKALKAGQTPPYTFTVKSNQEMLDLDSVPEEVKAEA